MRVRAHPPLSVHEGVREGVSDARIWGVDVTPVGGSLPMFQAAPRPSRGRPVRGVFQRVGAPGSGDTAPAQQWRCQAERPAIELFAARAHTFAREPGGTLAEQLVNVLPPPRLES